MAKKEAHLVNKSVLVIKQDGKDYGITEKRVSATYQTDGFSITYGG